MGIMTMSDGNNVVCEKKCEVKLERLNTEKQPPLQQTFKRPLSSITASSGSPTAASNTEDDLRPPVKLKVKIGNQGQPNVVKETNKNTAR